VIALLVVVTNNKGGQGKTFISTLLAFCLMKNLDNVGKIVCCDRNLAQQNFAQNLKNTDIPVVYDDPITAADQDSRLWIIDTSPDILENVEVIKKADIVVVPVGKGLHSLHGLKRIHEIRGKQDIKVILNEWSATSSQRKIEDNLKKEGYNVIGHMPLYQRIMNNLDAYLSWDYGLTKKQAQTVFDVLIGILK
jgi:MinD superfamily P-loop ATPase